MSVDPNIDKLEIDEKNVKVLEEKKVKDWIFYVWRMEKNNCREVKE